jgi:hypothetical protein
MKVGAKVQEKQFAKSLEEDEAANEAAAKISPNQLRGDAEDDSDEEPVTAESTAADTAVRWGGKARKRQRVMLKKMIDAEEQRLLELQEDEEDKDIEQYLVG